MGIENVKSQKQFETYVINAIQLKLLDVRKWFKDNMSQPNASLAMRTLDAVRRDPQVVQSWLGAVCEEMLKMNRSNNEELNALSSSEKAIAKIVQQVQTDILTVSQDHALQENVR